MYLADVTLPKAFPVLSLSPFVFSEQRLGPVSEEPSHLGEAQRSHPPTKIVLDINALGGRFSLSLVSSGLISSTKGNYRLSFPSFPSYMHRQYILFPLF